MHNTYDIAFHEAAHAMMAVTKGCPVSELSVFPEGRDGKRGHCIYHPPANFDVFSKCWVSMVGPVADTINMDMSLPEAIWSGGIGDFEKAREALGKFCYPKVPDDLSNFIGIDVEAYLTLAFDGWVPDGVRGQTKRKVTLFTNKCFDADSRLTTVIYEEAARIRSFVEATPWFLPSTRDLAKRLAATMELDREAIFDFFDEMHRRKANALD